MNFVAGLFRVLYPEFQNTVTYPDQVIDYWAGIAECMVRKPAWKKQWLTGVYLYTAHQLVLWRQNQISAESGGVPGQSGGIANTKTVGQATIGYDTVSSSEKDAGYLNLTNYGKQFIHMARLFGAGVIQL